MGDVGRNAGMGGQAHVAPTVGSPQTSPRSRRRQPSSCTTAVFGVSVGEGVLLCRPPGLEDRSCPARRRHHLTASDVRFHQVRGVSGWPVQCNFAGS